MDEREREIAELKEQLRRSRMDRDYECRRADRAWETREREAYLPPAPMTPSLRRLAFAALAVGIVLSLAAAAVAGRFAVELDAAPGCTVAAGQP